MRALRPVLLPLVVAASLLPAAAFAQSDADKSTARDLGRQGEQALEAKDYKKAEDDFRRADALYHAPTLTLGLARAQAAQGKVVEAWENYHRIILDANTSSPIFKRALDDANKEIAGVESRRARVTITVSGTDAPHVTLDDAAFRNEALGVERYVNPGTHSVKVTADGFNPVSRSFQVGEGGVQTVAIAMDRSSGAAAMPPPAGATTAPAGPSDTTGATTSPSSASADTGTAKSGGGTQRTLSYVAFGVGAVGLVVGGITGFMAIGKHGDLSNACPSGTCSPAQQSDIDSYHTLGTISTVGVVVGVVGVAAGAVLLLTAPKQEAKPAAAWVSPYVGPGSVGAVGRF